MKLVQMPRELLHVELEDLPALGVDGRLLARFEEYLNRATDDHVGLAILAPPDSGTRALLMVLARRVGAALRNENIRVRDHNQDPESRYKRLCYLPGGALSEAMRTPRARGSLEGEAALFLQDVELAWSEDAATLDPSVFLELLDLRLAGRLPTYANAVSSALPSGLEREIRARLPVLEGKQHGVSRR